MLRELEAILCVILAALSNFKRETHTTFGLRGVCAPVFSSRTQVYVILYTFDYTGGISSPAVPAARNVRRTYYIIVYIRVYFATLCCLPISKYNPPGDPVFPSWTIRTKVRAFVFIYLFIYCFEHFSLARLELITVVVVARAFTYFTVGKTNNWLASF